MEITDTTVPKLFNPPPGNVRITVTTEKYDLSHIKDISPAAVERLKLLVDMDVEIRTMNIMCSNSPINLFNLFRVVLISKMKCPYLYVENSKYVREASIGDVIRKEAPGLIRDIDGSIKLIPLNCETPIGTKYRLFVRNEVHMGPAGPDPVALEITTNSIQLNQETKVPRPFAKNMTIMTLLPHEKYEATMSVRETGGQDGIVIPSVDEWGYILDGTPATPERDRNVIGLRIKTISRGDPIVIFKRMCAYIYTSINVLKRKTNFEFTEEDETVLTSLTDIVIRENPSVGLFLVRPEDEKRKIIHLTMTYADPAKSGNIPTEEAWPIFVRALETLEREVHMFEG